MKNDGLESKTNNVIDMTERIPPEDDRKFTRHLKVRLDLEHAKVAVSTSLLSIVVLVTVANNSLMTTIRPQGVALLSSSSSSALSVDDPALTGGRDPASVPGGATKIETAYSHAENEALDNSRIVREISKRKLSSSASFGQKPSALDRLAFGFFEGRYAVRLLNGKISEVEYSQAADIAPKPIQDFKTFLEAQRDLLPEFERTVKVGEVVQGDDRIQTFQLVNNVSAPVAKVEFRVDGESRLLGLRVTKAPSGLN